MSWFKRALDAAELLVEASPKDGLFEKDMARAGIEVLRDNAPELESLGKRALRRALIHQATGSIVAAKTWAERARLRRLAQAAALQEKEEWDETWDLVESLALGALRAALPFVLAAL